MRLKDLIEEAQATVEPAPEPTPGTLVTIQPAQEGLNDRSGTITAGGTAQDLMVENKRRKYILIQNQSTGSLWFDFGLNAVESQPSIEMLPDAIFVMEAGFVSTQRMSIIGATTGQAFACKEG